MKNKYNIPHIKSNKEVYLPNVIEEYNNGSYYVHRRILLENSNIYLPKKYGIELAFDIDDDSIKNKIYVKHKNEK